jgi:hypothetical protein
LVGKWPKLRDFENPETFGCLLFPYRKSIENAKAKLASLKDVLVFKNVGHGIETYPKAIKAIGDRISL